MNEAHHRLCSSPEWATYVEDELLPWALESLDAGDDVVELGPGPGRTTDVLRRRVTRLTAVERDPELAEALARRLSGSNVTVVCGDATALDLPDGRYSAVACFTMLHHVPSAELQQLVFQEAHRVLRPAGLLVGADGLDTPARRELHVDDVFVPVDAATLADRLASAGFQRPVVETAGDRVRFHATR
jgi:SAM-dependent methyltransferase